MWHWFKKFCPDLKSIEHSSSLRKLKKYLHHSYLWDLEREVVARGVAIGLFVGVIPIIPFQTLLALFLCIFFRGNFAIAFLATWISNPITIVPITYFTYYIGTLILGKNGAFVVHDYTLDFSNLHVFWSSFTAWFYQFGKAFFVGLPIISIGAALIGYFLVTLIWHMTSFFKSKMNKDQF
jgi:uncharacterized protein (DUF2062 family)